MTSPRVRVLFVIPGDPNDPVSMIFAKRQIVDLSEYVDSSTYYIRNRLSLRFLFQDFRSLRQRIEDFSPHVIHAQYGTMTSFICCLLPGVRKVMSIRGSDIDPHQKHIRFFRKLLSTCLTHISTIWSDKIIAVSDHLGQKVVFKEKVVIASSGISEIYFKQENKNLVRKRLGWDLDGYYVFFNAGKSPLRKRLDLAEKYFEDIKKEYKNVHLIVLRGETAPDLACDMLAASDLLFMTSEKEGSPNIVKEALALKVPVVAHDVGDVANLVSLDLNSRCFRRNDPEAFVSFAKIVLKNRLIGTADMTPYRSRNIAQKIFNVYLEVLSLGKTQESIL